MRPTRATCISCNTEFGPNGELASIPDAERVAFDDARGRVWRICEACNEWNLLGAEVASIALPELRARFAASAADVVDGIATSTVGARLRIIHIDAPTSVERHGVAKVRAAIASRRIANRVALGFTAALLAIGVTDPLHASGSFANSLVGMAWLVSWMILVKAVRATLRQAQLDRWIVPGAAWLFMLTSIWEYSHARPPISWAGLALTLLVSGLMAGWTRTPVNVDLDARGVLRIDEYELSRVTVDWDTSTGALFVHDLPWQPLLSAADTEHVLQSVLAAVRRHDTSRGVEERAEALLATVGGRSGLFATLDGFRNDRDGRVNVSELPEVYRVALEMALARSAPPRDTRLPYDMMRAQEIADQAELLDHTGSLPVDSRD